MSEKFKPYILPCEARVDENGLLTAACASDALRDIAPEGSDMEVVRTQDMINNGVVCIRHYRDTPDAGTPCLATYQIQPKK